MTLLCLDIRHFTLILICITPYKTKLIFLQAGKWIIKTGVVECGSALLLSKDSDSDRNNTNSDLDLDKGI